MIYDPKDDVIAKILDTIEKMQETIQIQGETIGIQNVSIVGLTEASKFLLARISDLEKK